MLQKRRLTVHPVDAAQFCGYDNGAIVSFLNGVDHVVIDPAATDQDDAQLLPSRVLAHTYTGAQLADVAVDTQRECVVAAAVSSAAVVACRVTPLAASQANPAATYPVRMEGPSKIVFFSGCQRLAEVRLSAELASASDDVAVDAAAACPMQCFRVEAGGVPGGVALDIAAFMEGPNTLCTCTPQLGKLQTVRFEEQRVCCMGPGRVGKAEVTVVLSSGVAVLCGVPNASPFSTSAAEGETAFDVEEQTSPTSAAFTASLTAAARRAFAVANARSNLRILHTVQLPSRTAATSAPETTITAADAAPRRVAWSGASTLWVVYADGSVVAIQCAEAKSSHRAQQNEEALEQHQESEGGDAELPPTEPTLVVEHVLQSELTAEGGTPLRVHDLHVNADPRAPVLHLAFTSATDASSGAPSWLYYGTARVSGGGGSDNTSSLAVQWRLQWMSYDERLYGLRFERGRYHILTQGCRGGGPLFIAALPRSSPVHTSQVGVAAERAGLAAAIMASPENELVKHCRTCESLLRELHVAAQHLSPEDDADAVMHRFMQAQHALYALLRRQHQSLSAADLAPSESLPYRLLQRAARLYRQLSVYVLLLRLGVADTVTRPVREVLRLEKAATISSAAQAQWTALMRDTFRSASVYQSAVSELAMWQSPTPLCVELLLNQLGLSLADATCTMTVVLNGMDALTADYALFVLYYSYCAMGCAGDAETTVPSYSVQEQRRRWRETFLLLFGQPIELNAWAFACYTVDHGINPAEQRGDAADAPPLYILGPAVHHLGTPPFTKLLGAVLNGLAHVAALDVLLHAVPSCLAVYTAAMESVPLSVSMRLLCVAVRAGSHRMIAALYEVMRNSPLLQDLAAQPLAFAALATRDVSGLRGWVEVGSPVADTIERTLQASENVPQRESVLIAYNILMQRYEDALRVCTSATAADATQAQRLQVVLSYLRSLLPASTTADAEASAESGDQPDVNSLLPLDTTVQQPWLSSALAAPALEINPAKLAEELKRAAAASANAECGSSKQLAGFSGAGNGTSGTASAAVTTTSHHPYHVGAAGFGGVGGIALPIAKPPLFRPSTLLTSVERRAGSRGAASPSPSSTVNESSAI